MNFYLPDARACCGARTSRTRCTTSTRCAAQGARRAQVERLHRRRAAALRRHESCSPAITGRCGAASASASTWQQRDIYRYIHDQTLRLANRASRRRRSPRDRAAVGAARRSSRTAATTAPCATTPRPCTRRTSAGTTATRRIWIRCRPSDAARATSRRMGGAAAVLEKAQAVFERASIAGLRRWSTTSCSPSPPTAKAGSCCAAAYEQLGYQAGIGSVARRLPHRRATSCATACRHGRRPTAGDCDC